MRDLSEQGFSLRAMMPLRQSEKVPFSFVLDAAARIDGEAIVVRIDDGGHVAALEFAGLPSHSRDQIHRWLDKFDEPISPDPSPVQSTALKHLSLTELRSQIRAPKPPSPAPSAAESAPSPPPPKVTTPSEPEPRPVPIAPVAETTSPPPQMVATPPTPAPPPMPVSAAVETAPPPPPIVAEPQMPEPPPPPVAEIPQPPLVPTLMALPRPTVPPQQEAPPPAISHATFEPPETSTLPPLLKLSSVRPGPLPTEAPTEPVVPAAIPKPVVKPPAKIQVSLPIPEPSAAAETPISDPSSAPPVAPRRLIPPPLEPLSSLEAETDSDTPVWMDHFTLGRAIGIMLFLVLFAGSYVYHREVGQALIWLGHQIAGDDSPENSKVVRPVVPPALHATPEPTPPASAIPPHPLTVQESPDTSGPKSANLPAAASDKTPSPQLKDATQGSLVPLTQITRPPAPAPPADNSIEAGQQEYLEALQILRSPSRASEVPAAIQLLWVAMEKGNTGAEIDLAELFRTGRGVAKNCDQARVLLSAAARKGSAEARKRLEAFRREGCSN
jgi:hypothetical protein